jgi:hypothetical protein
VRITELEIAYFLRTALWAMVKRTIKYDIWRSFSPQESIGIKIDDSQ